MTMDDDSDIFLMTHVDIDLGRHRRAARDPVGRRARRRRTDPGAGWAADQVVNDPSPGGTIQHHPVRPTARTRTCSHSPMAARARDSTARRSTTTRARRHIHRDTRHGGAKKRTRKPSWVSLPARVANDRLRRARYR